MARPQARGGTVSVNDIRIIPPGLLPWDGGTIGGELYYYPADTIEITDEEWDEIYEAYDYPDMWERRFTHDSQYTFSCFLRELIELKREVGQ
jgi:hypothetical protein